MGPELELELVDYLLYEPEESGILWIKFNRPERLNALYGLAGAESTMAKVGEYMRAGDADPNIRVIVLTGVGKAFCAGADMKSKAIEQLSDPGVDGSRQHFSEHFTPLFRDISNIRKPTIAMLNGAAVGAGLDMALHCDIRLDCENTRFSPTRMSVKLPKMARCIYCRVLSAWAGRWNYFIPAAFSKPMKPIAGAC